MTDAQTLKRLSSVLSLVLLVAGSGASTVLAVGAQEPPPTQPVESHVATGEAPGNAQRHAVAQEHGNEHAVAEHEGPTWGEYGLKWINFVLLASLLYWVLVVAPPFVRGNFEFDGLREILAARSQQVIQERDLAQQQKVSAESRLADSAARLERIEDEAAALLTEAGESAEHDKARIVASASTDAEAIRATASRDLDAEVARSRRDLQAHIADQAVSIAKRILQDNFSAEDQRRLVREHLDMLGETVA